MKITKIKKGYEIDGENDLIIMKREYCLNIEDLKLDKNDWTITRFNIINMGIYSSFMNKLSCLWDVAKYIWKK